MPRPYKDDARFLKTSYLRQTEAFFHKYGGRSIVLARFVLGETWDIDAMVDTLTQLWVDALKISVPSS